MSEIATHAVPSGLKNFFSHTTQHLRAGLPPAVPLGLANKELGVQPATS